MSKIDEIIFMARVQNASDIHITAGLPLLFRVHGKLTRATIQPSEKEVIEALYEILDNRQRRLFDENGEDIDVSIQSADGNRQRVNIFRQQGKIAATIRLLDSDIPTLKQLHMSEGLYRLVEEQKGLVLVAGPAGSGRSTTMASLLSHINDTQAKHIITLENPVEYTYPLGKALIHQREIGRDVKDYPSALRSVLREDPDIILISQLSDYETISAALIAAETGHLVLASLYSGCAVTTVRRIIGACPTERQNQVRFQLADALKGIITRQLIPLADGSGRTAATEILLGSEEVAQAIRDNRLQQLDRIMSDNPESGMHTLSMDLLRLVKEGSITLAAAQQYAGNFECDID